MADAVPFQVDMFTLVHPYLIPTVCITVPAGILLGACWCYCMSSCCNLFPRKKAMKKKRKLRKKRKKGENSKESLAVMLYDGFAKL